MKRLSLRSDDPELLIYDMQMPDIKKRSSCEDLFWFLTDSLKTDMLKDQYPMSTATSTRMICATKMHRKHLVNAL